VLHSKYGRYQPEAGTAFFIRSDHVHTVLPIKQGYRSYVALEFWPYMSEPVPSANVMSRASIVDAKPFPKKEEF
jgi:hypothetical protein